MRRARQCGSIDVDDDASRPCSANVQGPLTPPAPGEPGGLANDMTPVSEAPFTQESAQGAANVVQTYYALIGEGKYRQAWALWGNAGQGLGDDARPSPRASRAIRNIMPISARRARIDAGAGQRYVTVPVQAYGG
jgi:hypothetical protein